MHNNFLWQAFLVVVLLVTLAYSGIALYHYYAYSHLTAQTDDISAMHWQIQEKSDTAFVVKADYTFTIQQQAFEGSTAWTKEPYLNRYAAEQAIKLMTGEHWQVWYDQHNPHRSSLQKQFPIKECLSALFLWVLLLYFVWLGYYVAKFKT